MDPCPHFRIEYDHQVLQLGLFSYVWFWLNTFSIEPIIRHSWLTEAIRAGPRVLLMWPTAFKTPEKKNKQKLTVAFVHDDDFCGNKYQINSMVHEIVKQATWMIVKSDNSFAFCEMQISTNRDSKTRINLPSTFSLVPTLITISEFQSLMNTCGCPTGHWGPELT